MVGKTSLQSKVSGTHSWPLTTEAKAARNTVFCEIILMLVKSLFIAAPLRVFCKFYDGVATFNLAGK